jgi:hypothetical protein
MVESKLWLGAIHRRLTARRRIRQPFTGVIHRDIPLEIFNVLVTQKLGFSRPSCYVERSNKAVVIAFADMATTCKFLSLLSAVSTENIN